MFADAITVLQRLLFTLNIPLASERTASTLLQAKPNWMFFRDDSQTAFTWNIEAPYIAFSESKPGTSVLCVVNWSTATIR